MNIFINGASRNQLILNGSDPSKSCRIFYRIGYKLNGEYYYDEAFGGANCNKVIEFWFTFPLPNGFSEASATLTVNHFYLYDQILYDGRVDSEAQVTLLAKDFDKIHESNFIVTDKELNPGGKCVRFRCVYELPYYVSHKKYGVFNYYSNELKDFHEMRVSNLSMDFNYFVEGEPESEPTVARFALRATEHAPDALKEFYAIKGETLKHMADAIRQKHGYDSNHGVKGSELGDEVYSISIRDYLFEDEAIGYYFPNLNLDMPIPDKSYIVYFKDSIDGKEFEAGTVTADESGFQIEIDGKYTLIADTAAGEWRLEPKQGESGSDIYFISVERNKGVAVEAKPLTVEITENTRNGDPKVLRHEDGTPISQVEAIVKVRPKTESLTVSIDRIEQEYVAANKGLDGYSKVIVPPGLTEYDMGTVAITTPSGVIESPSELDAFKRLEYYVNIPGTPKTEREIGVDDFGRYRLVCTENKVYKINVTNFGYNPIVDTIKSLEFKVDVPPKEIVVEKDEIVKQLTYTISEEEVNSGTKEFHWPTNEEKDAAGGKPIHYDSVDIELGFDIPKVVDSSPVITYTDNTGSLPDVIRPLGDYDAMKKALVKVAVPIAEINDTPYEITTNGNHRYAAPDGYKGMKGIQLKVNVSDSVKTEALEFADPITENNTYNLTAPAGKAWNAVKFKVNVQPDLQRRYNDQLFTGDDRIIEADDGYYGIKEIKLRAVTASRLTALDSNFVAQNIKSGVSMFGLVGTFSGSGGGTSDPVITMTSEGKVSFSRGGYETSCEIYGVLDTSDFWSCYLEAHETPTYNKLEYDFSDESYALVKGNTYLAIGVIHHGAFDERIMSNMVVYTGKDGGEDPGGSGGSGGSGNQPSGTNDGWVLTAFSDSVIFEGVEIVDNLIFSSSAAYSIYNDRDEWVGSFNITPFDLLNLDVERTYYLGAPPDYAAKIEYKKNAVEAVRYFVGSREDYLELDHQVIHECDIPLVPGEVVYAAIGYYPDFDAQVMKKFITEEDAMQGSTWFGDVLYTTDMNAEGIHAICNTYSDPVKIKIFAKIPNTGSSEDITYIRLDDGSLFKDVEVRDGGSVRGEGPEIGKTYYAIYDGYHSYGVFAETHQIEIPVPASHPNGGHGSGLFYDVPDGAWVNYNPNNFIASIYYKGNGYEDHGDLKDRHYLVEQYEVPDGPTTLTVNEAYIRGVPTYLRINGELRAVDVYQGDGKLFGYWYDDVAGDLGFDAPSSCVVDIYVYD